MTPYDAVPYPTWPNQETHPGHLAAIAFVHGRAPAPPEHCRVLEIGCGTAQNIVSMAYTLPGAAFTGIDLAASAVAEGQRRAAAAGVSNLRLCAMNLLDITPQFGEFDYILAHGIYSWVPPEVRDKLLAVCRDNLAPQGVAFVSYNAYPGCHLRQIVRDIMRFHTAGTADPAQCVGEARALLTLLADAQTDPGLAKELRVPLERTPNVLYHDDLSEINAPVYLHEFAAHAQRHGLQFLSEASMVAPEGRVPEALRRVLEPLESDRVRWEQYLDFIKMRRFRETLLCRAEAPVGRAVSPDAVRGLYASSDAKPAGPEEPDGAVEFLGGNQASAKTAHPLAKACLALLGREWPRRLAFEEILEDVCGATGNATGAALAEILWYTGRSGLVKLHADRGSFTTRPGEYPVASALARHDLLETDLTATLAHDAVRIEGDMARRLVISLDGTRNRDALAKEFGVPLAEIEEGLAGLARMPLLVA